MADERRAKLTKLEHLRRSLPAVSQSALQEVLQHIDKDGLPALKNRNHMRQARKSILAEDTPYGKLLATDTVETTDGKAHEILILQPLPLLSFLFDQCCSFRDMLRERHQANPSSASSPWSLILYTDEVTPGNPLAPIIGRKIQAIYWSFAEFGSMYLCRENCWMCMLVHRSTSVKNIVGTMGRVIGLILKYFFLGASNLLETGVFLSHGDEEPIRLFAKLGTVVQDGAAHKDIWYCKGDSGMKMCLGCNALHGKSDLIEHAHAGGLVQNATKASQLVWLSDADVKSKARRLTAFHECRRFSNEGLKKKKEAKLSASRSVRICF